MVQNHKQIDEHTFRETFGRYYEDFEPGHVYQHRPGRTISETDNTWFTLLTMNTHPLHFDAEYAAASEFGRILVNSAFTVSLVVGMSVSDVSQKAIANLGWKEIRLPAPVFVGDTLYAEAGCAVLRWIERHGGRRLALQRMQQAGWDPDIFLGE